MAMNIKYDGTTWAVPESELPDYINRSIEQPGSFRRTYSGAGRRHTQFDKWTIPLSWSMVGTAVRTHVSAMAQIDGTITLEYDTGTFITRAEPGSYSEAEASYQAYDLGITLKEI